MASLKLYKVRTDLIGEFDGAPLFSGLPPVIDHTAACHLPEAVLEALFLPFELQIEDHVPNLWTIEGNLITGPSFRLCYRREELTCMECDPPHWFYEWKEVRREAI